MNKKLTGLLITISLILSVPVLGSVGLHPFSASVVCYQTPGIVQWNFIRPRQSTNHQALVSIELAPGHNTQGQFTQSVVVKAVEGLYWDKDFENIYYKPPSKPKQLPILCARKLWYGLEKNEKDCSLKGEINPSAIAVPEICGLEKAFLFQSLILVNN